ncbi:MAG: radical SAM protein [Planctomycetes bacterium]|nr:radical SAM protein [Planctomycetota bacterium]
MGDPRIASAPDKPLRQYADHSRDWRGNLYVYPVISRRSRGLSIGVNLNPDAACNFDCVYCQVDRSVVPRVRDVDVGVLRSELAAMIECVLSGALFADPAFNDVPDELRRINDVAFSGDGEPTTCNHFADCVRLVARLKREAGLTETKIVLITDACYLLRPEVEVGLTVMDENNGEIWAKLDAGTEAHYRRVNRPNYPIAHVIANIIAAARVRPIVIQSLFMRLDGVGPGDAEITAYVDRLRDITRAGGTIDRVQVYTLARAPAEAFVSALAVGEVDRIAARVRDAGLSVEAFRGSG